jgi:hypothetical protein
MQEVITKQIGQQLCTAGKSAAAVQMSPFRLLTQNSPLGQSSCPSHSTQEGKLSSQPVISSA